MIILQEVCKTMYTQPMKSLWPENVPMLLKPGDCLNIKMSPYEYRDSHYEDDQMVSRLSYLYNVNPHTWKDRLFIIPSAQRSCRGVYWFHSVRPSVCPPVCPASCVSSVAATVLVGSISYLHILSSNFRRCVTYKVFCKILIFGIFKKFVTLTLSCFDFGSDVNH